MAKHLQEKVEKIEEMGILNSGDIVLDIGCNDGTTLKFFSEDFTRVGIDPTVGKFNAKKYPSNIKVNPDFFSKSSFEALQLAKKLRLSMSFSMFYDLPDPVGFAQDIARCLKKYCIWIFEQSYLPKKCLRQIPSIQYAKSTSKFYSLKQIIYILERAGLRCIDVTFNDINGGSFSVTAAQGDSAIRFFKKENRRNQE